MTAGSTVYSFRVLLSDTQRNVYQTFTLQSAHHDSEPLEALICRVLAFSLEYEERLELIKGLYDPDLPAIWAHDLTGKLTRWIEVGWPSVNKLQKACKRVPRVSIFPYEDSATLLQQLKDKNIYNSQAIEVVSFAPEFLPQLLSITEARNRWGVTISEDTLYLESGDNSISTHIDRRSLASAISVESFSNI